MKTTMLLILSLSFSFSIFAYNPNPEVFENQNFKQVEMNEILDEVLDVDESKFIAQLKKKNRVIIIDENFNKIREESVNSLEEINSLSILVPFIYRSEFVTKIHNVSYFMLDKK